MNSSDGSSERPDSPNEECVESSVADSIDDGPGERGPDLPVLQGSSDDADGAGNEVADEIVESADGAETGQSDPPEAERHDSDSGQMADDMPLVDDDSIGQINDGTDTEPTPTLSHENAEIAASDVDATETVVLDGDHPEISDPSDEDNVPEEPQIEESGVDPDLEPSQDLMSEGVGATDQGSDTQHASAESLVVRPLFGTPKSEERVNRTDPDELNTLVRPRPLPWLSWRYSAILLVSLVLLVGTFLYQLTAQQDVFQLHVLDSASGQPISGANVAIGTTLYATDSDGEIRVDFPREQTTIIVRADGYQAVSGELSSASRSSQEVRLRALPA